MKKKLTGGIVLVGAIFLVLIVKQASGTTLTKETAQKVLIPQAIRASFCVADADTKTCKENAPQKEVVFGVAEIYPKENQNSPYSIKITLFAFENAIYHSKGFSITDNVDSCETKKTEINATQKNEDLSLGTPARVCDKKEEGIAIRIESSGKETQNSEINYILETKADGSIKNAEIKLQNGELLKLREIKKIAENIEWRPK